MPSVPKDRNKMIDQIPEETTGTIFEIGSGGGGLALAAAKRFPQCKVVGIEYSLFPFLISKMKKLFFPKLKNLSFVRADFFDVPLDNAPVALCYLTSPILEKLKDKFVNELADDARIITCNFKIPDWETEKEVKVGGLWTSTVLVYRKNKKVS